LQRHVHAKHNPNGSPATLTYPSGRIVTYAPNAASQPVSAMDGANGINYVTSASYAPQGGLSSLTLGYTASFAGIQINDTYNTRLQPNELKAWSTAGVAFDLTYGFIDGNGKNNGNVVQVTNNKDTTRSQQFTYDQLNRILTAKTTATSGANCWSYTYGIDVWANLNSAQPISGYSCTQSNLSLSINTNNQITNTGVSYDASGNTLADELNTYAWDAESQIKTAAGVNYTYDGDGNRVQKSNGKIYWYGAGSEVLDESDASGNITDEYIFFGGKRVAHRLISSGAIYYYAEDLLGSSRVITTSSGTVCYEADIQPFGKEVPPIINSCPQNYKFTGKERDAETGNDDFGARYFSPSLGRWLSPDWSAIPAPVPYATLTNPQSLNLYGYVGNNPETFADVDGHLWPIGIQDPSIQPFDQLGQNPNGFGSSATVVTEYNQLTEIEVQAIQAALQQSQGQSSTAGPALKGPYVADLKSPQIDPLLDQNHKPSNSDVVGPNGECVDLTKKFSGMGKEDTGTYQWRPGPKVVGNKDIQPGTAIATFNDKDRFPNKHHWNSGIYLGPGVNGSIWILDQWPGYSPRPREVHLDKSRAPADNSAAYSVVYVVPR
jgi:RHS repeat-associated protein